MFDLQNVKHRTFRQLAYNSLATHHPVHKITTRQASIALSTIFLFLLAAPAQVVDSEHARKTPEIYEHNVEVET